MINPKETQAAVRKTLEQLVKQLNDAADQGIRLEFTLGPGQDGRQTIQRYECWARIPGDQDIKQ